MTVARRIESLNASMSSFLNFYLNSDLGKLIQDPKSYNFAIGNPQEMPLPALSDALSSFSRAKNKDWFGYKMSEHESQTVVAQSLRQRFGTAFEPADIAMTNGGFAAIALSLFTVANPDDK